MLPLEAIDTRAKLLHVALTGVLLFIVRSLWAGVAYMALLALLFCLCGRPLFALKAAAAYALALGASQLLLLVPSTMTTVLSMLLFMIARFVPLSALVMLLLQTTGTGQVIQALESWRVPRVVTVPVSVMFRFAPTIGQEVGHITDALRMRGLRPSPWGLVRAPAALLEHLFLPLLMRATKVSEELAASAVVRGIESPEPRTVRLPLRWQGRDSAYLVLVLAMFGAVVALDKGVLSL
ncbi:MAG: energy-coupling factor transporter transmembrane protein EcfT [Coriobacteriales bacterium]|jgi:energy-coupling factor transport system permease protein|nr:energy-coupling factor transporter transmembrane protein EcfT [Coriobacteriales bacterium]